MSSQSRPRTGTEEAAAAAAGVASAENAVAPPPNGSGVANQQQAEETQQPFVVSTAPLTFTDFLEKMRAPAAMDLVRGIKGFISEMLKSQSVSDAEADSERVQNFLSRSEIAFNSHPLWAASSHEEVEAAGEGLEKYLMTKLYGRCFGVAAEDKERDDLLKQRMEAISKFIKPAHLDIPDKYCNEQSWTLAQKELQKINTYKAPRDKLVCILNCCRVISNVLSVSAEGAGADDFLPILIYVVITAVPPQLESNLAFIMRYRLASRLNGETAYFYTNMVSATTFIETISPSSLSIDPNEFIAHMQAAGVPGSEDPATNPNPSSGEAATASPAPSLATPPPPKKAAENLGTLGAPGASLSALESEERRESSVTAARPSMVAVLPPLETVEEKGSTMLLEAESLGDLHVRYKFLYSSLSDLKLKDLGPLLQEYKELALKYESIARGYKMVAGGDLGMKMEPEAASGAPAAVKTFFSTKPMMEAPPSASSSENLIRLADSPAAAATSTSLGPQGQQATLPTPPLSAAPPAPNLMATTALPTPPGAAPNTSPLPDLLS